MILVAAKEAVKPRPTVKNMKLTILREISPYESIVCVVVVNLVREGKRNLF